MRNGLILLAIALVGWSLWRWRDDGPPPPLAWDERMLRELVADLADARERPAKPQALRDAPRILLYFSGEWCPHCREFTPELVEFYRAHGGGSAFQVLFVSDDDSAAAMRAYMRDYDMPWWGVRFGSASATKLEQAYPGSGIPRLVLLDGQGRILADVVEHGRYVGWHAVLKALADGR
jgi:thiol-disulfide isomerase/thioredoxin